MIDYRESITRQLETFFPYIRGNYLASLIAVKGTPGPTELEGNLPFSGADGLALDKALSSLGWGFGSQNTRVWLGIIPTMPGYPELSPSELRLICEVVDPLAIISLDESARLALIRAFEPVRKTMASDFLPGAELWVLGRQLVSVDGFEEALCLESSKQKVWSQLKRCQPTTIR